MNFTRKVLIKWKGDKLSFVLCDGNGNTRTPCTGCTKNPCEELLSLKQAETWLNNQPCSMALDFGVTYCCDCDSEIRIITLVGEAQSGGFIGRDEAEEILREERKRFSGFEGKNFQEPQCFVCGGTMVHKPNWSGCAHWHCEKCDTINWPAGYKEDDRCPVCGIINDNKYIVIPTTNGKTVEYQGMKCLRCGVKERIQLPKTIIETCEISAQFAYDHKDCKEKDEDNKEA